MVSAVGTFALMDKLRGVLCTASDYVREFLFHCGDFFARPFVGGQLDTCRCPGGIREQEIRRHNNDQKSNENTK